jgi:DNA-binding response OmpR family regulator
MLRKTRVLVVDDDANVRDLIRVRLDQAGYDVHTARTGLEAISRIGELCPSAMVLDINMPEMDGFGVLAAMKQERMSLPVLVLTARHAGDDVRRAIGLGAKDYLTKPFNEAQLLARVARLMRRPLAPPPAAAPTEAAETPPPAVPKDIFI